MYPSKRVNDSVHWFMSELTSRIVAESGIPTDRYHLGKILLRSFKDEPDFVSQIDGGTGESETNRSVLERTVRCAIALKNLGLKYGDVITLMAPNHIDLAIPFYAALYLGVVVSDINRTLGVNELQSNFELTRPKVVFCQSERARDVHQALNGLESEAFIVTFDKGDFCRFPEFLEKHGDSTPTSIEEFKPTDFDPEDTIALLISTSGSTGLSKVVAATHKNLAITGPYLWSRWSQFPNPTKMAFVVSPLHWLTAIVLFLSSPIMRFTRMQSSRPITEQHAYELFNTYKPTYVIASPVFLIKLIESEGHEQCDFSCFETFLIAGSAVTAHLIQEIKKVAPNAEILNGFGISEVTNVAFLDDGANPGNATVGKPIGWLQYRLIDVQTQEDIREPNKNGELWLKGPGIFKNHYRNPTATAEAFTEDRWFKTGDMFYRDEQYNFFFVERIKLLLRYMTHQISPAELEATIRQHPGVLDVAVTGVPDPEGEVPVACVVRRPGHHVSAAQIKDLVKDNLADSKQLRGGVIFLDAIPITATIKIDRMKLKEVALQKQAEH